MNCNIYITFMCCDILFQTAIDTLYCDIQFLYTLQKVVGNDTPMIYILSY